MTTSRVQRDHENVQMGSSVLGTENSVVEVWLDVEMAVMRQFVVPPTVTSRVRPTVLRTINACFLSTFVGVARKTALQYKWDHFGVRAVAKWVCFSAHLASVHLWNSFVMGLM